MRLFELGHPDDIARQGRGHGFLFFALQMKQLAETLFGITSRIIHDRVALHLSGKHMKERQFARLRVNRLEHPGGKRRARVGAALDFLMGFRVGSGHTRTGGRRRQQVNHGVQHRLDAQSLAPGETQNGKNLAGRHPGAQSLSNVFCAQLLALKIACQEIIVCFGNRLDQFFTIVIGLTLEVSGNGLGRDFTLIALEHQGFHRQQVNHPPKAGLRADRHMNRGQGSLKRTVQSLDSRAEFPLLAVHPGQTHDARQLHILGPIPQPFGLNLELAGGAGDEDGAAHRLHGIAGVR